MVWLLLGLLFIATGLYLGFDYTLTFVYLIVGAFCSLYGLLLFIFLRIERPKKSPSKTPSPDFISAGTTAAMPAVKRADSGRLSSRADADSSAPGPAAT